MIDSREHHYMARQQQVDTVFIDDLTGEVLAEDEVQTVTFAVDAVSYEIDLSKTHASSLRNDFAAWIEHARTVANGNASGRSTRRATADNTDS